MTTLRRWMAAGLIIGATAIPAAATDMHDSWSILLSKYVSVGRVDYRTWQASAQDRRALVDYLERMAAVDAAALNDSGQIAHFLNLYNASMVELVLRNYPVDSVKRIGRLLGPWKIKFIAARGDTISLDQIEHEILRKRFREPRIHFALVCASVGCPPLRGDAYSGEKLDEQLAEQQGEFLRNPAWNRARVETQGFFQKESIVKLEISSIFDWFGDDFGGDHAIVRRVSRVMELDTAARRLIDAGKYEFDYLDYDWSLNERR